MSWIGPRMYISDFDSIMTMIHLVLWCYVSRDLYVTFSSWQLHYLELPDPSFIYPHTVLRYLVFLLPQTSLVPDSGFEDRLLRFVELSMLTLFEKATMRSAPTADTVMLPISMEVLVVIEFSNYGHCLLSALSCYNFISHSAFCPLITPFT